MKLGILCLTYNRINYLERLLEIFDQQEDYIALTLVVNNNSSDGTAKLLDHWKDQKPGKQRVAIHLDSNSGGAGGYYAGLLYFQNIENPVDYIYIADDDAFPEPETFARFTELESLAPPDTLAICAAVHCRYGIDLGHRKRIRFNGWKIHEEAVPLSAYSQNTFDSFLYSFVGTFLKQDALRLGILPDRDYFISYDDTEHAFRVSRHGKIICFPELQVYHQPEVTELRSITWKRYYVQRNHLLFWKHSFGKKIFLYNSAYYLLRAALNWATARSQSEPHAEVGLFIDLIAYKDALFENKGLHRKFRPGWQVGSR